MSQINSPLTRRYTVVYDLQYNGKRYAGGSQVMLPPDVAAPLITVAALREMQPNLQPEPADLPEPKPEPEPAPKPEPEPRPESEPAPADDSENKAIPEQHPLPDFDTALAEGLITRSGSWYSWRAGTLGQGVENARTAWAAVRQ